MSKFIFEPETAIEAYCIQEGVKLEHELAETNMELDCVKNRICDEIKDLRGQLAKLSAEVIALENEIAEAEIKVLEEAAQWLAEDAGINARDALLKRIEQRKEEMK